MMNVINGSSSCLYIMRSLGIVMGFGYVLQGLGGTSKASLVMSLFQLEWIRFVEVPVRLHKDLVLVCALKTAVLC